MIASSPMENFIGFPTKFSIDICKMPNAYYLYEQKVWKYNEIFHTILGSYIYGTRQIFAEIT